ncbi:MAG TPA: hypothetical protein VG367_14255 [Mucilaginibacter sp.]|jgi:hypothetical protein|nr:hypothetical protein [Mucilaginibacter sp.]
MKKIYYLLALVALAFTACQKQPVVGPGSASGAYVKKGMQLTLTTSDYQLLDTSAYPHYSYSFDNLTDANLYVPTILNLKEPQLSNGSTALVTFAYGVHVFVADSVYKDLTYTVTSADYTAAGSTFGDFSAAEALNFVQSKYTSPQPQQLVVLTYVLYTGVDNTVTSSFLYINGAWKQIYQVSNAQYALVGDGKFDQFANADLPKLGGYFNFFLKNDISVASTAKAGDVQYVSYNHFVSSSKDYQDVMALTYDGANWHAALNGSAQFLKSNGTWIADPTVYYTLTAADCTLIANSSIGGSALASVRASLGKYDDFEVGAGEFTPDLIDQALILVLQTDFPSPKLNVDYKVTYLAYTGVDTPTTITFQNNGTAWVVKP